MFGWIPFASAGAIFVYCLMTGCFTTIHSHRLEHYRWRKVHPFIFGLRACLLQAGISLLFLFAVFLYLGFYPPRMTPGVADDAEFYYWICGIGGLMLAPVVGILTGLIEALFQWLRLKTKGACQCGYDLTVNVSGICPKCGRPAKE